MVRHAELLGFTARSNNGQEGCGRDLSWLYLHPTLPSAELWLQLSMSEAGVTNLGGSVDVKAATSSRELCHVRAVAVQLMGCVAAAYQPCPSGWGALLRDSDGGAANTADKMNADPAQTCYNELESVCYTASLWFVAPCTVRAFSDLSVGSKEVPPATSFFGSIRGGIMRNGGEGWGSRRQNRGLTVAKWGTSKPSRRCVLVVCVAHCAKWDLFPLLPPSKPILCASDHPPRLVISTRCRFKRGLNTGLFPAEYPQRANFSPYHAFPVRAFVHRDGHPRSAPVFS